MLYPQTLRRHFSASKWGITLAHFWKEEADIPLLSLSALRRITTVTAECLSQLPDPGPLAYGEYQVLLQLFPEQCVAQGMWLLSACQGNEVPSPLSCLPWSWPNAVCLCEMAVVISRGSACR